MIETILDWLEPAFTGTFGYLIIGIAVMLDRGAFIGFIAPGDVFLALGGIFSGRGDLSLPAVIAVGFGAAVAGEMISYWLGRHFGRSILRRVPLANRLDEHVERAEKFFERHGGRAVFLGRYISVVGTFLPFTAGMSNMPFPRFVMFDVIAVVFWAAGVGLLGYFLSSQVELVQDILSRFSWGLLSIVLLGLAGRMVWRRRDRVRDWIKAKKKTISRS